MVRNKWVKRANIGSHNLHCQLLSEKYYLLDTDDLKLAFLSSARSNNLMAGISLLQTEWRENEKEQTGTKNEKNNGVTYSNTSSATYNEIRQVAVVLLENTI